MAGTVRAKPPDLSSLIQELICCLGKRFGLGRCFCFCFIDQLFWSGIWGVVFIWEGGEMGEKAREMEREKERERERSYLPPPWVMHTTSQDQIRNWSQQPEIHLIILSHHCCLSGSLFIGNYSQKLQPAIKFRYTDWGRGWGSILITWNKCLPSQPVYL